MNVKHLFVCVVESIDKNKSRSNFLAFFSRKTIFERHFSGTNFPGTIFPRTLFQDLFLFYFFSPAGVLCIVTDVIKKTRLNEVLCVTVMPKYFLVYEIVYIVLRVRGNGPPLVAHIMLFNDDVER